MKPPESRESDTRHHAEPIRQKLGEAHLYLTHGLFDEAREIYLSLLRHFGELAAQRGTIPDDKRKTARDLVRVLKTKVEEVDRRAVEFYGRPKAEHVPSPEESARDGEAIFNAGLALEQIGLYREAIEEFKRAAELRYRTGECYEHLGGCHILAGNYLKGIETLRRALKLEEITPARKAGILQEIASACQKAGDKKRALETYRELLAVDPASAVATAEIDRLDRELKGFRFSLGPEMVCRHPRIFLAASLLFAAVFLVFLPFVKTVANVDYFTLENDRDAEFYKSFKRVFGEDEFFVIGFTKDDIFTTENLTLLKKITEDLSGINGIRKIRSLANVDHTVGESDYFEVRKFLERIPEDKEALDRLRQQAINNPLYVKNLVSSDARTAAILVGVHDRPEDEGYRKRLIDKTWEVLDRYRDRVDKFHLAGWTTINLSFSQFMRRDLATFIPVTYLLVALTVFLIFRNLWLTLLAVFNISIALGSTMGLFAIFGFRLNNVTTIVPPLIMAYALSDTNYIFTNLERQTLAEFPDKNKALAAILRRLWVPCFLTSFTTFVGFLSCAASEIPPIREFAWVASIGVLFEWIYSFYLMPPLILLFRPEKLYQDHGSRRGMAGLLGSINRLNQRHYKLNLALCGAVALVGCWFASKVQVETNVLEYFKKTSAVRTSLAFIEENLSGVMTLDVSLQGKSQDVFKEPVNLRVIETIQEYVKSLQGVDVAVSFIDFIKEMNQSFHNGASNFYSIPESREMVSQYLLLYDSDAIEDFMNSSYDHARIAVRISRHSSAAQEGLIADIRKFTDKIDHPGLDIIVTGRTVEMVNIIDAVVTSQVYSLGLAGAIIAITMCLALKSITMGFLALVPNAFPLILNFGLMGVTGIHLNTATALISAIALGIAVDNTIQFLSEYQAKRREGISRPNAVKLALFSKGRGMMSTTSNLCLGFGVLLTSGFVPTIHFGLLTTFIMITALIGAIVLLPSMLLVKGREQWHPDQRVATTTSAPGCTQKTSLNSGADGSSNTG